MFEALRQSASWLRASSTLVFSGVGEAEEEVVRAETLYVRMLCSLWASTKNHRSQVARRLTAPKIAYAR